MVQNTKTSAGVSYAQFVSSIVKPGEQIKEDITPAGAHLWHMATGVAGEAGELLDAVKKHVVYKKILDLHNVVEELGDLEFYMEGIRQQLGITRDEVILQNVEKLSKRYAAGKYTDAQAQTRADKVINSNQ